MTTYTARPMFRGDYRPYPWSELSWTHYRLDAGDDPKIIDKDKLPPPGKYRVSRTGRDLIVVPRSEPELRFFIETFGGHPVELDGGINHIHELTVGEDGSCTVEV